MQRTIGICLLFLAFGLEQGMRKVPVRHTLNDNFERVDFRLSGFSPTRNFGPYPGGFRYNRHAHYCRLCIRVLARVINKVTKIQKLFKFT